MKMFSVTYHKNKSVNIHASFSTPKEAKKWMDEMLAQRKAAQQSGQGEDDYSCPRCGGDLNEFRYCAACGYPYPSPRPPLTPTKN